MTIRGISDLGKSGPSPNDAIESFAGGEKSGIAIQQPDRPWPVASGPPPSSATVVSLYQDGFVIDDGPLRPLADPENANFLEQLRRGEAPEELRQSATGDGRVNVLLKDMGGQPYEAERPPAPSPNYTLFAGEGQTLGGGSTAACPVVTSQLPHVSLDPSRPTTQVAFRFHDGTRVTQTFNTSASVGDIHSYVVSVAPVSGGYILRSGFPPRPITDNMSTTLEAAGLCNETIVQSLRL